MSLLAKEEAARSRALERLDAMWGPLDYLSRPLAFDYTSYYEAEMGAPLTRRLASFRPLVGTHELVGAKRACGELERELADGGRRNINLDPGLLSEHSLILASTKPAPHRICIAEGYYAELTLLYHHGGFHPLPWTYPDYAGEELTTRLTALRGRYLWQLKATDSLGEELCPNP